MCETSPSFSATCLVDFPGLALSYFAMRWLLDTTAAPQLQPASTPDAEHGLRAQTTRRSVRVSPRLALSWH